MAAALEVPVAVMESAGEGGAWGIALLAAYRKQRGGETLEDFLSSNVFAGQAGETVAPDPKDTAGFREFMKRYSAGLLVERAAVDHLK
jgi:sugar (pentulose or hexulose) kinase